MCMCMFGGRLGYWLILANNKKSFFVGEKASIKD